MGTKCICGLPLSIDAICRSGGEGVYSVKAHCEDCGTTFEFNHFTFTQEEIETLRKMQKFSEEPVNVLYQAGDDVPLGMLLAADTDLGLCRVKTLI